MSRAAFSRTRRSPKARHLGTLSSAARSLARGSAGKSILTHQVHTTLLPRRRCSEEQEEITSRLRLMTATRGSQSSSSPRTTSLAPCGGTRRPPRVLGPRSVGKHCTRRVVTPNTSSSSTMRGSCGAVTKGSDVIQPKRTIRMWKVLVRPASTRVLLVSSVMSSQAFRACVLSLVDYEDGMLYFVSKKTLKVRYSSALVLIVQLTMSSQVNLASTRSLSSSTSSI